MKLQGIFPPIATPFDHDGDLTEPSSSTTSRSGTSRRSPATWSAAPPARASCSRTEEKLQLWEWVAEYAAPGETADRRHRRGKRARDRLAHQPAAEMGYKAAMVRTPHYYKNLLNRAEAQTLYFRAVADQSKIPLMIYNWPQATGVDIPAEAVAALSEHPNIIAIKESSGNLEKVMQMIREVKPGFQVLVGSAPTLWPSLAVGAAGAVLAYANAAPYSTIAIWEAHRTRDVEAAAWTGRTASAARPAW